MTAPAVREHGAAVRFPLPPLLFAIPLAAALLARRVLPLPLPGRPVTTSAGIALVLGGVVFSLSGAATVLRHGTTVVPHRPVARLVIAGPFRISRNPMYTGHAVSCAGAALWAGSWWPLMVLPLSMLATHRLVIGPEEEYLGERFGDDYARYRAHVRRWI
ncbi:MAG TPA: isoprenylcysteine carboxylmethyltransferase family protein [Pseudonocardia sp.]|nr:isoprenylcysteine carboxylmethyltransferase family protein [Pseudonocardia sp.]